MKAWLELTAQDVHETIPYALICEAKEGSRWNTGKRRRKWAEWFTPSEREACTRLFARAHDWTLCRGVPRVVRMSAATYLLWKKVGDFCASF